MTITSIQRVRSLADLAVEDIALVGNKAATPATYIEAISLPTDLPDALAAAVQRLGRRSSGSTSHAAMSASRSAKGPAAEGVDREGAEK
jgi:hypothetical protein